MWVLSPFSSTFPLYFARIWLDAKSVAQNVFLKKKSYKTEAFSGPWETCVFRRPFVQPAILSGASLSFTALTSPIRMPPLIPTTRAETPVSPGRAGGGGERRECS